MQATRERIVEAAIELSTELGLSRTTRQGIALRADVAPGTLRNHFPTRESLERAMIERLTAEAPLPDLSIYDGARSLEERVARLIRVTGTFLDQSTRLYRMWQREPMVSGSWAEEGARYGARWDELMKAALGPLADDADAMSIVRAVLEPTFFDRVRAGQRGTDEASALIAAAITPWLAGRSVGRTVRSGRHERRP
jgi:AcrR family transcriptional regulator